MYMLIVIVTIMILVRLKHITTVIMINNRNRKGPAQKTGFDRPVAFTLFRTLE